MRAAFVRQVMAKEVLSTLRDRRALISNLLIPLLILPFVMLGLPLVFVGLFEREGETVSEVAVRGLAAMPAELVDTFGEHNLRLVEVADPVAAVRDGDYQAALVVEEGFAEALERGEQAPLTLYSRQGNMRSELNAGRISSAVRSYEQGLVAERLAAAGLDPAVLEPLSLSRVDAGPESGGAAGMMSWLIPFLIAIWTLTGGQMTAIDATAGEKERGTLEALLVAPVRRGEVVLGKVLATMTTGLSAALMAIVGFLIGGLILRGLVAAQPDMAGVGQFAGTISLSAGTILLLLMSALLLAGLMAALLISITMFAKSFKEAQSYLAPLSFAIILPLFALQFSDFLDYGAALYSAPVLGVMLTMADVISGDVVPSKLLLSWGATTLWAVLLLGFAYRSFRREDVLFRG
ncbi:ABC transporter permease [soil metagenome]